MSLFHASGETDADIGTSTEFELDMQTEERGGTLEIVRIMVEHVSGSASNFQLSVGNLNGFTNGTINNVYLGSSISASVLMDIALSNLTTASGFCSISRNGKLYLKFTPDSGTNNKFAYSILFRR